MLDRFYKFEKQQWVPIKMPSTFKLQFLLVTLTNVLVKSKIYSHCELAMELLDVHEIPKKQLATWVCLAEHESNMNTSAMNMDSGDHGLFQISQLFWCSPPGYACGVSCTDLRNDDIEDDVVCARRIYREHKRLSGDGFNAWVVYKLFCNGDVSAYIDGCFEGNNIKIEEEEISKTEKKIADPSLSSLVLTLDIEATSSPRSLTKMDKISGSRRKESTKITTKSPASVEEMKKIMAVKIHNTTPSRLPLTSTERAKEKDAMVEDTESKSTVQNG